MNYIELIENNDIDGIKKLIADGWDVAEYDNHAIRYASGNGHLEIVKLLLTHTIVDPSARDNHAIICASHNGYLEIVKLLLTDKRVRENLTQDDFTYHPELKSLMRQSKIESLEL